MLSMKKMVELSGFSVIDGVQAEGYTAKISSDNPADMTIASWQQNKEVYKANRTQCRADKAEFEDAAYALQDAMLAEMEAAAAEGEE